MMRDVFKSAPGMQRLIDGDGAILAQILARCSGLFWGHTGLPLRLRRLLERIMQSAPRQARAGNMVVFGRREKAGNQTGKPKPESLVRKWHNRVMELLDTSGRKTNGRRGAKRKSKLKRKN